MTTIAKSIPNQLDERHKILLEVYKELREHFKYSEAENEVVIAAEWVNLTFIKMGMKPCE